MTRRCSTCEWWYGPQCRGAPPAPDPGGGYGIFPNTLADAWCGLWRPREAVLGGEDVRTKGGEDGLS